MAYCRPNSLNTRLDASPEGTSGLSAYAISPIVLWAALGGSHHCAQDEPEPGALRERRRFPHNSAEMLTRDTGGLVIGQSESGRRAARYKLTHQDWPGGLGPKKCSLASLSDMAVFRSQSGRQVTWDLTEVGDRAKFSVQAVPE